MIGERRRRGGAAAVVELVLGRWARGWCGRVDIVPARVNGEVLGNVALLPVAVRGGVTVSIDGVVTPAGSSVPVVVAERLTFEARIVFALGVAFRTVRVLVGEVFGASGDPVVASRFVACCSCALGRVRDVGIGAVRTVVVVFFGNLEHGIALEGFLNFLFHFQSGQLQQAYRLLQLRSHGE